MRVLITLCRPRVTPHSKRDQTAHTQIHTLHSRSLLSEGAQFSLEEIANQSASLLSIQQLPHASDKALLIGFVPLHAHNFNTFFLRPAMSPRPEICHTCVCMKNWNVLNEFRPTRGYLADLLLSTTSGKRILSFFHRLQKITFTTICSKSNIP